MYYHFFGFHTNPFSSIPHSNSNYLPAAHQSLLSRLLKDLKKKTGTSLLLGPAGVGKTFLVKRLIAEHSIRDLDIVLENLNMHPNISADKSNGMTALAVEANLADNFPGSSQKHVLLLDQADNVDDSALIKILSVVSKRNKNNQPTLLILIGLPQLEARLKSLQFQPYAPLLNKHLTLEELSQNAVKDYILHRLHIAGCSQKSLFADDAIQSITKLSRGVPQIINTLCGNSLFQASLDQTHVITAETVSNATEFFLLDKDSLKEELTENLPILPVSPSPTREKVDNTEKISNSDQIITQSLQEITQMLSEVSQIGHKTSSTQEAVPYEPISEQQITEEKAVGATKLSYSTIPERSGTNAFRKEPIESANLGASASTFVPTQNTQSQLTPRVDNHSNRTTTNKPSSNDEHIGHGYKISLVTISILLSVVTIIWVLRSQFINESIYNTAANEEASIVKVDKSEPTPQHSQSENKTDKIPDTTEKPLNTAETITTLAAENIRPQYSKQSDQPITLLAIRKPEVISEIKTTRNISSVNHESIATKVSTLLSLARGQEKYNQLTQPMGDNVIDTLQHILKLDPDNTDATQDIQRIKEIFIRQAKREKNQAQWQKAEASFIKAQRIDPTDSSIVSSLASIRQKMQVTVPIINQATIPKPIKRPKSIKPEPDGLELAAEARAAARYKLTLLGIPYNFNSFLTAADTGDDTRLKLFLDAHMPVNAQDSLRNTALIKAATQGHVGAVKLLLNKKPAINWQNKYGKTALMLAAEKNQIMVVKTLLMHGASRDLEDAAGQTALSIAQRSQNQEIVFLLRSKR